MIKLLLKDRNLGLLLLIVKLLLHLVLLLSKLSLKWLDLNGVLLEGISLAYKGRLELLLRWRESPSHEWGQATLVWLNHFLRSSLLIQVRRIWISQGTQKVLNTSQLTLKFVLLGLLTFFVGIFLFHRVSIPQTICVISCFLYFMRINSWLPPRWSFGSSRVTPAIVLFLHWWWIIIISLLRYHRSIFVIIAIVTRFLGHTLVTCTGWIINLTYWSTIRVIWVVGTKWLGSHLCNSLILFFLLLIRLSFTSSLSLNNFRRSLFRLIHSRRSCNRSGDFHNFYLLERCLRRMLGLPRLILLSWWSSGGHILSWRIITILNRLKFILTFSRSLMSFKYLCSVHFGAPLRFTVTILGKSFPFIVTFFLLVLFVPCESSLLPIAHFQLLNMWLLRHSMIEHLFLLNYLIKNLWLSCRKCHNLIIIFFLILFVRLEHFGLDFLLPFVGRWNFSCPKIRSFLFLGLIAFSFTLFEHV